MDRAGMTFQPCSCRYKIADVYDEEVNVMVESLLTLLGGRYVYNCE